MWSDLILSAWILGKFTVRMKTSFVLLYVLCRHPLLLVLSCHFKEASPAQPWEIPVWETCSKVWCSPGRKNDPGLSQNCVMSPPLPISKKHILFLSVRMFLAVKTEIQTNPDRIAIFRDYQHHPELPITLLTDGLCLSDENKIGCWTLLLPQSLLLKLGAILCFSGNSNSSNYHPEECVVQQTEPGLLD